MLPAAAQGRGPEGSGATRAPAGVRDRDVAEHHSKFPPLGVWYPDGGIRVSGQRTLVFGRNRSLRVAAAVGATFLAISYVAPIAVAASQAEGESSLPQLATARLRVPGVRAAGRAARPTSTTPPTAWRRATTRLPRRARSRATTPPPRRPPPRSPPRPRLRPRSRSPSSPRPRPPRRRSPRSSTTATRSSRRPPRRRSRTRSRACRSWSRASARCCRSRPTRS